MSRGLIFLADADPEIVRKAKGTLSVYEKKNNVSPFNLPKIKETLTRLIAEGYGGAYDLYGRVNIREHMNIDPKPGSEVFDCFLIKGHVGWFYEKKNVYRYYTKFANSDDTLTYTFDLADLFMLLWRTETKAEVYARLATEFPYVESPMITTERCRYEKNRTFLTKYMNGEPTILDDVDTSILRTLMTISEDNFFDTMNLIEGKTYFFASLKFIHKQLTQEYEVTLSQTNLSNRINRLATLGFIQKVGERKENRAHYQESMKIFESEQKNKSGKFNPITYYVIETFERNLRTAEKHNRKLERKKIRLDQITESEVEHCFGTTWVKRVFPVKTQKKAHKYASEKKAYTEAFFVALKKQGYVTKAQLNHLAHKKLADRLWTFLVKRATGIAKRLSKKLNNFLGTDDTGAVMLSYRLFHSLTGVIEKACKKGEKEDVTENKEEKARILAYLNEPVFKWVWPWSDKRPPVPDGLR